MLARGRYWQVICTTPTTPIGRLICATQAGRRVATIHPGAPPGLDAPPRRCCYWSAEEAPATHALTWTVEGGDAEAHTRFESLRVELQQFR